MARATNDARAANARMHFITKLIDTGASSSVMELIFQADALTKFYLTGDLTLARLALQQPFGVDKLVVREEPFVRN